MINRRTLLAAGALAPFLPTALLAERDQAQESRLRLFSAIEHDGNFGAGWIGVVTPAVSAGFRGHGGAAHPIRKDSVVLVGRRPGRECAEISMRNGQVVQQIHATSGRHFCGHGCFSPDGALMITTESVYGEQRGVLGVRDARNYQWLGEIDLEGIGPHEVRFLNDGNTLVVALGGILTHPDRGREKLNLKTMQPELIYVDLAAAKRIDGYRVADRHASIRHLAVAGDDTVAVAMQYQRDASENMESVALFGAHRGEEVIHLFDRNLLVFDRMDDYLGSVEISNHNRIVCATSPRGNQAAFWHLDSGELLGMYKMNDVCGLAVAPDERHFVLTNSNGEIRWIDTETLQEQPLLQQRVEGVRWDNHLVRF